MKNGYTLTRQVLTYDGRVPDAYDWQADNVDPLERWVLREYDRIVASRVVNGGIDALDAWLRMTWWAGMGVDLDGPDWHEYLLYAEELHAAYLTAQRERLPLAV